MEQELANQAGLDKLSPQQKEELMKTVQTQVALANMQELLTVSYKNTNTLVTRQRALNIGVTLKILRNYQSFNYFTENNR